MPAPAVYVVAALATAGAVWAFTQFVYIPHIHPEVTRIIDEMRNSRQPAPPHSVGSDDESDDDDDSDNHSNPWVNTTPRTNHQGLLPRRSQPGTPRTRGTGSRVDSDEERYGPPFDARGWQGQASNGIELADLAPEVREWRRHDQEDAATLRRRNFGPSSSPSGGSPATSTGTGRGVISHGTPRFIGHSMVEEPTRRHEAFNPFLTHQPSTRARAVPPASTTSTLSTASATPIATGTRPATVVRSAPPARLPAATRVDRHSIDRTIPTHVIADPEDYSPPSTSASTTAPGTPNMSGNRTLRSLNHEEPLVATTGSMLFSRDGESQGSRQVQQQPAASSGRDRPAAAAAVVDTRGQGVAQQGASQGRPASPTHTDLSSLITSPPLPTLPAIINPNTPIVPAPAPVRGHGSPAVNNAVDSRAANAAASTRQRSTEGSPIASSPTSFQTASTNSFSSPLYSPSILGSLDTLTTPVQASYTSSPAGHGTTAHSPTNSGNIPSLSQTYHPQDLDYERGVILLSPPSSRSESPFSVVSTSANASPGSRSPALSTGTNYMSLDGSVDGTAAAMTGLGLGSGFGRSPLVPQQYTSVGAAGTGTGLGSPVQGQAQAQHPRATSPASPTPSNINYDSDFDLLSSAANSPYSMSPFASPHIGTIRHSISTGNNGNLNTMSPPPPPHQSGSPTAHAHRSQMNSGNQSPVLQRATSPSTTSTSISDIDLLDDDDSLGFNSDGWVSDHNPTSRR